MSLAILKSRSEIISARRELIRRGLSFTRPRWKEVLRKFGIGEWLQIGDTLKSWDVLRTVEFVSQKISRTTAILDIGAFASEVPCILHRLGYTKLLGIDLDKKLSLMPSGKGLRYFIADFMRTPFKDGSFGAVTAISVIEHGYKPEGLLAEVSRLLMPGGHCIVSFDYWPDKIETGGKLIFGMAWMIFSERDVLEFIEKARIYGLTLTGEVDLKAVDRPIHCMQRDYTFGWVVLTKQTDARQELVER
jgi:SAM-dependent methyltransferase